MSYYMVHKQNPYFKPGTMIQLFEDGFQECVVEQRGHRTKVVGNKGLLMPEREVKPYCMRVLAKGLDKPSMRRKAEYA